jgi:hypothetical protein
MLKTVLGVRKQTSKFACRLETCREPIIIYILTMIYKYYKRISNIDVKRILHSAFITDCKLYNDNYKSCISNILKTYNIIGLKFDSFKIETIDFTRKLKEYYHVKDIDKLEKIGKKEIDSKLDFYTSIR